MSTRGFDLLQRAVIARTAPGALHGEGVAVAYCDAPQVLIRQADGTQFWWRADLCAFGDVSEVPPMVEREMDHATINNEADLSPK